MSIICPRCEAVIEDAEHMADKQDLPDMPTQLAEIVEATDTRLAKLIKHSFLAGQLSLVRAGWVKVVK